MKYLTSVILFLICFSSNAENKLEIIGQINDETLVDIKSDFNSGVDVMLEGYLLRTLPKNLANRIYRIQNDDGYFKIFFTQHDNQYGYDILSAKHVCSSLPCKLTFFNHAQVKY
ncbi:hypothetical protein [Pseudoalteromonas sp. P1-9]|uniref:hypothetical protein n=1 Tax=Pseudoalteromonas sp. P1-9 TaxID=1710354 RepID=UPI0006D6169A|nr:hypothetical protein [Pseudoalteromonas sp. P1-9]